MALVDCQSLCGLTGVAAQRAAATLPDLAGVGLSPELAQDLAAHATATPVVAKNVVSARALAEAGGPNDRAPGDASLARARGRVLTWLDGPRWASGGASASKVSVPAPYHVSSAAVATQAAAEARAHGTAIETSERARITSGRARAGPARDTASNGIASAVLASFAGSSADSAAMKRASMAGLPSPQAGRAGIDAAIVRNTAPGPMASRWISLHGEVATAHARPEPRPPRNPPDGPGTDGDTSENVLPPRDLPPRQGPESGPLAPPPFNVAAMAALAGAASLYRANFGISLASAGALSDLAETIESFNDCLALRPPMDQEALEPLSRWSALARGVGAVRERMGVDLLQPGGGNALSAAILERQPMIASGIAAWQEERAQTVMGWLILDQAAIALNMPTNGPGALRALGFQLRKLAGADVPECVDPMRTASMLAMLDNARTIRNTFGVNALSLTGADRLRAIGERVRDNVSGRTRWFAALAPSPSMTLGLTYPALARFSRIDRTQASDLGVRGLTPGSGPLMTSAPAVLAVLAAAHDVGGRSVIRRGPDLPRRSIPLAAWTLS